MKKEKIIIVGAGLCGSLLAIRLAQRGYDIVMYERRADMRKVDTDAGRSINLALSARGLEALEIAGLKEKVLLNTIPMKGRMIHPVKGAPFLSPYSGRSTDFINSVSRSGLNILLLDEIDKYESIDLKFGINVTKVSIKRAEVEYLLNENKKTDRGSIVIGTDGAGSVVRRSMMPHTSELLFNYSQDFLRHGYKELSIHADENNNWKIEKEALHIWPRGDFMIIALPNLDGSFTLTMFHPFGGNIGFRALNNENKVQTFFKEYFPTLLPYVPHYKEEYFSNPVGNLGTIKCYPWQAFGKTLVMGDASHAIVPFYGQGMNASLEDVRIFDELIDEYEEVPSNDSQNWEPIFEAFQEKRKENTDAIADLAIDNFYEMRDHVDDVAFIRKRKIEMQLEEQFDDYASKYSMVTFQPELTYREAMIRGRKQDLLLLKMCENQDYDQIPLEQYYQKLKEIQVS